MIWYRRKWRDTSGSMDYTECERLKKEIIPYIEEHLKPSRLEHTLRVTKLAKEMAEKFGADVNKAEIAALLHDMAKYEIGRASCRERV